MFEVDSKGVKLWRVPMALGNLAQEQQFWGAPMTKTFPSILPRAVLFDMVQQRSVTVAEQWLACGWAHPDIPEVANHACDFPFQELVSLTSTSLRLTLAEQRDLLGNSMNFGQLAVRPLHLLRPMAMVSPFGLASKCWSLWLCYLAFRTYPFTYIQPSRAAARGMERHGTT